MHPAALPTLSRRLCLVGAMACLVSPLLAGEPRPDQREVIAAQLFPLDALPPDLGRRAMERLALLGASPLSAAQSGGRL